MSNANSIAAVTATLRSILQQGAVAQPGLADATVTILPLDKARGANTNNQINLFLYMVVRSAAWVNADMPRQVHSGEIALPPLPLNLYYLVTAFGINDDVSQPTGHALLGQAMSILHDHPVLSAADISAATVGLPPSDLENQLERVRVTFHPLSIEELSKLWTGFAMQYRLSAAYEVAVTLIESTRSSRPALPVLKRGAQDQGVAAQADLASPLPTLGTAVPANGQPSAVLGTAVRLGGSNLDGPHVSVVFTHPSWASSIALAPQPGATGASLSVLVPAQAAAWPAGIYSVSVLVQRPGETFSRETNALTVSVAPSLTLTPATAAAGSVTYTATVSPDVLPAQRVSLMLGSNAFDPDPHPAQTGTLSFQTSGLAAGDYWVRLRVDGIDSLLVDRSKSPPVFDPTQKVTIT